MIYIEEAKRQDHARAKNHSLLFKLMKNYSILYLLLDYSQHQWSSHLNWIHTALWFSSTLQWKYYCILQKKRNKVMPGNNWDVECYASRNVSFEQMERFHHPSLFSTIHWACLVKLRWCLFQLLQGQISSCLCWGEISQLDKGNFYKCHWYSFY